MSLSYKSLIPDYFNSLIGKRIRLTAMPDDPHPVEVGTIGQVEKVNRWPDGTYHLHVKWEGKFRSLGLVCPPDEFEIVE